MLHNTEEVRLWVRPEVLELAVIPVLPPDKISVEMLSRLLQYARDLGDRGYPTITYETWKHIAVKKMGLSTECCQVMFCSCRLFSQRSPTTMSSPHYHDHRCPTTTSPHDDDSVSCDSEVWTLELVTLLYLQRITTAHPRIMARQASLHSLTTDPWPSTTSAITATTTTITTPSISAASAPSPTAVAGKKKLQEEYNLEFIKDSLSELLSLLAGHLYIEESANKAQKRRSGDWRSVRELLGLMRGAGVVGVEVVRAMDLVIGLTHGNRSGLRLLDVATDKTFCYQSGFLSKKNTFQKGLFEQWVLSRLDWAPHGEWLCMRRGRRPPHWPVVSASHHYRLSTCPPPDCRGERLVCITDLVDAVTVHLGDAAANTTPKKRHKPSSEASPPSHDNFANPANHDSTSLANHDDSSPANHNASPSNHDDSSPASHNASPANHNSSPADHNTSDNFSPATIKRCINHSTYTDPGIQIIRSNNDAENTDAATDSATSIPGRELKTGPTDMRCKERTSEHKKTPEYEKTSEHGRTSEQHVFGSNGVMVESNSTSDQDENLCVNNVRRDQDKPSKHITDIHSNHNSKVEHKVDSDTPTIMINVSDVMNDDCMYNSSITNNKYYSKIICENSTNSTNSDKEPCIKPGEVLMRNGRIYSCTGSKDTASKRSDDTATSDMGVCSATNCEGAFSNLNTTISSNSTNTSNTNTIITSNNKTHSISTSNTTTTTNTSETTITTNQTRNSTTATGSIDHSSSSSFNSNSCTNTNSSSTSSSTGSSNRSTNTNSNNNGSSSNNISKMAGSSSVVRSAETRCSDACPALLDLKLRRCVKSQVYVLQPLRHVLLHKLQDCKVVLGPVGGRLRITECRNTVVVCPARSIVISDSRCLTLYTLTPHRPLLVGSTTTTGLSSVTAHQGVTLAPLNMHYPRLLQHISTAGLNTHLNKWNQPLRLGLDGRCEQSECGVLPHEDFQLLALPFFQATVDGRPPLLPPGLPPSFLQAVQASQQGVCSFRAEVEDAALTPQQRVMLQKAIDHRVKAWLRETGKQRELDLLDKLTALLKQEKNKAGVPATATAV